VNEPSLMHHVGWMVCQCKKHFSIVFHYKKLHPSKPHYLVSKTKKKFIYNYCVTIPLEIQCINK
jgi:hypothetical protein